jgi:uncharacterized membrane protein (UPF0127 family)
MILEMKCPEKNIVLGKKIKIAESLWDRLIGLMFKEKMEGFDGLLIRRCNSVHTCFMRYNLDLVFLDRNQRVVKIIRDLRPYRFTGSLKASEVLELRSGDLKKEISLGDRIICLN